MSDASRKGTKPRAATQEQRPATRSQRDWSALRVEFVTGDTDDFAAFGARHGIRRDVLARKAGLDGWRAAQAEHRAKVAASISRATVAAAGQAAAKAVKDRGSREKAIDDGAHRAAQSIARISRGILLKRRNPHGEVEESDVGGAPPRARPDGPPADADAVGVPEGPDDVPADGGRPRVGEDEHGV